MALFDKDSGGRADGPGTIVGAHVKLTGVLKDSGDITIHGQVEGEVVSEHNVVISETAEIKGPISGDNVMVAGTVNGAIAAKEKLEILPTGVVQGSISMADLIVHSGATFVGKSTMSNRKTPANQKTHETKLVKDDAPAEPANKKKALTYELEDE